MKKFIQISILCILCLGLLNAPHKAIAQGVEPADSLLLVELFKQANGGAWSTPWDTLSDPVSSWYGVQTTNGRVTGIDLESNNLFGAINLALTTLTELENFNIGNNSVFVFNTDDFPTSLTALYLDTLFLNELPEVTHVPGTINVAGNNLTYGEFDKLSDASNFIYAPQNRPTVFTLCEAGVLGGDFLFEVPTGGVNTNYDWSKDASSISNSGSTYLLEEITTDDFASYSVDATNPDYPLIDVTYNFTFQEAPTPLHLPHFSSWTASTELQSIGLPENTNNTVVIEDIGNGKYAVSDISAGSYQVLGAAENHPVVIGPTCAGTQLTENNSEQLYFSAAGIATWDPLTQVLMVPWQDVYAGFMDTTYYSPNGSGLIFTSPDPYSSQWESVDLEINWTNVGVDHNPYSLLQYSFDDENWYNIDDSFLNDWAGTYTWTMPDGFNSNSLRLRIIENSSREVLGRTSKFVVKAANPASLVITDILDGATITGGQQFTLNFNGQNLQNVADEIHLWYSVDGEKYYRIAEDIETFTKSYDWNVPALDLPYAIIRATASPSFSMEHDPSPYYDEVVVKIESADPFSIDLTAPQGGDQLAFADNPHQITFSNSNVPGDASIVLDVTTNGGDDWEVIEYAPSAAIDWDVPAINSDEVMVRMHSRNYPVGDTTGFFSITAADPVTISLTNMLAGSNLAVGEEVILDWTIDNAPADTRVDIYISYNGGVSYEEITTYHSESYNWTVPETTSEEVVIKVKFNDRLYFDVDSTGIFSIISPEPGISIKQSIDKEVIASDILNITYTAFGITTADISYSTNSGTSWNEIVTAKADTGTNVWHAWTTPDIDNEDVWIRVLESGGSGYGDTVKGISIQPAYLNVLHPTSQDTLITGTADTIKWETNVSGEFTLEYNVNDGDWNQLYIGTSPYIFTVPADWVESDKYQLKFTEFNGLVDSSDYFTVIKGEETLELTYPNGGEEWTTGEDTTITWNTSLASGQYEMHVSADGGNTFAFWFDGMVADGQARVTIPAEWVPGTDYMLKISAEGLADSSDATFSVSWPPPEVADISGSLFYENIVVNPEAILYNDQFEALDTVAVVNNSFLFENVMPGTYYQKVNWQPAADTSLPSTYYGNTALWNMAEPIVVEASYEPINLPLVTNLPEVTGVGMDDGTSVKGTINAVDDLKKAMAEVIVENTMVYLLNPADSSLLFATRADDSGAFLLGNISPDDYLFWMDIPLTEAYAFTVEAEYETVELDVNVSNDGTTTYVENIITSASNLLSSGIRLYPVPANDVLNISLPQMADELYVIDATGNVVKVHKVNNRDISLNTSDLTAGFYYILIKTGQQIDRLPFTIIE